MKIQSFDICVHFIKAYPLRSTIVLFTLVLAGVVETVGIGALLPLLNAIVDTKSNTTPNMLTKAVNGAFDALGIEQSFRNLLLIIVITICSKALIVFYALRLVAFAAADITRDLRVTLIQSLMSAKWQYFSTLPIGESATSIASEAENSGYFFIFMWRTIAALIQTAIYLSIAFLVDWKISLTAIIVGSIGAYCLKFLVQQARKSGGDMAESLKSLLTRLNESLSGAKPLKAMGEENRFLLLLKKDIDTVNQSKKRQLSSNLMLQAYHEPMMIILISCGLYWAFIYAHYPLAELLLIAFLFHRLITQTNIAQSYYQKTINFEGSVSSILAASKNAKEHYELMLGEEPPSLSKGITFKDATLSYGDNIIFDKFSDEVPANKMSVIFGPSGVGKSTLLDATLGLLALDSGDVFIDGRSLKDINIKKWRHMIGYVPQETFLFHDTIFQNITLGDSQISEDKVIEALKISNAWEFVQEIDDGLQHVVGERGGKLSGGQKQRLALARALVRAPKVLILDEATTGLDKESEDFILAALKSMLPNITIIAISHDPKILDIADHVIRLGK